ncbi:MAG: NAD(P)-binding domain-containing protein [Methylotenera sp.]|nr:NAD(P)-binding domain-containing protein [Oligoflexia bacterium]
MRNLCVAHLSKSGAGPLPSAPALLSSGPNGEILFLDTCQRWLWVFSSKSERACSHFSQLEVFRGEEAYRFLLSVATGLESRLQGETNIFGQIKEAWGNQVSHHGWMQKLFEDTKEIRSLYLNSLGRPSYGKLVAEFLKQHPSDKGTILILGAGDIAKSVVPELNANPHLSLSLWNRSPEKAERLRDELNMNRSLQAPSCQGAPAIQISNDQLDQAWKEASHVLICIPFESRDDLHRISLWNSRELSAGGAVLHLGGFKSQSGPWQAEADFYALDDLFSLQTENDTDVGQQRLKQLARARRACIEKAKLRVLGSSLSHGWEDLAAFAF